MILKVKLLLFNDLIVSETTEKVYQYTLLKKLDLHLGAPD